MTTEPKDERGGDFAQQNEPKTPSDPPPVREGLGSVAWQTVDAWIRAAEDLGCAEFAVQNVSDLHRLRDDIASIGPLADPLPVSREAVAQIIDPIPASAWEKLRDHDPVDGSLDAAMKPYWREKWEKALAKADAILALTGETSRE